MKLNIDQILEIHHAWDFEVTIGGKTYATVRPSVGELGVLISADKLPAEQVKAGIEALFAAPAPDISTWRGEQLTAFLNGFAAYFQRRIAAEKKQEAIAQLAVASVEKQMAS
jgi:hypothetical protein